MSKSTNEITRRGLLKTAAAGAAGVIAAPLLTSEAEATPAAKGKTMVGVPFEKHDKVRAALIGCGGRGSGLLNDLLAIEAVEITAVCDTVPEKVARAQSAVTNRKQPKPQGYDRGPKDYERLCAQKDIDLIYIATPWDLHAPMAKCAMLNGKHAASEVPMTESIQECWDLVDTSEKTRKHCIMLENCCYGYWELLVLNMVKAGVFGELTHGEAAYIHDLRGLLFSDYGEALWRRAEHTVRDGNLYPTHGLGPVANYMDIHRGDRFDFLVSVSSPQKGFDAYRKRVLKAGDPRMKEKYVNGDMNTSLIKTVKGLSIMLQHDTTSPRPYSRINMISGTKGTFNDYPPRIFIDGVSGHDDWEEPAKYRDQYEHPLWKRVGEIARKMGGHGGMDYIMSWRLIECMRKGLAPDMDVYDGAAWSAPNELSARSIAKGSAPIKFPDFTRGNWKTYRAFAGSTD